VSRWDPCNVSPLDSRNPCVPRATSGLDVSGCQGTRDFEPLGRLADRVVSRPPITVFRAPSVSYLDISPGLRPRERKTCFPPSALWTGEVEGAKELSSNPGTPRTTYQSRPIRRPLSSTQRGRRNFSNSRGFGAWRGNRIAGLGSILIAFLVDRNSQRSRTTACYTDWTTQHAVSAVGFETRSRPTPSASRCPGARRE
jgi:hypothetical protein